MKKSSLKTAALQYKELSGFSVIPVGPDKRPLLRSWKIYQTRLPTDEEINRWWTQFPNANIGIVTGKVSGITVVDVDTHKGGDASKFPRTFAVRTGNGGLQLYYKYHEGLTVSANAYPDMPYVDIRNDTGYVVAPPSITSYEEKGVKKGGKYTIVVNVDYTDFPAALFPVTKKKTPMSKLVSVSLGSRNSSMAALIGTIVKPLHDNKIMTDGWDVVQAVNRTYSPPLPLEELQTTFNSIVKKEMQRRANIDTSIDELDLLFVHTAKGEKKFIQNTENMCRILRKHSDFKGRFRFDEFKSNFEISINKKWRGFELGDEIDIQSVIAIAFSCFSKVDKNMVYDAMIKVAKENSIDSAADYIRSIVWDKTPRVDEWLTSTYGTASDAYHKAVASNWLKGLVKRIIDPGCKFDYVLVLEGPQGSRKSTSLAVLGASWHVETTMSTDNKDFFMQFAGKAIVEFSEGETMSRTEVKKMKAIITTQIDRYRPPWGKISQDFPRRCVFAMTTNQEEYLKDETGNRRWLPVKLVLSHADVEWLEKNRDQLFAEAYYRVSVLKEKIYEFPEQDTLDAQDARRISDPNAEPIAHWYFNKLSIADREAGITIYQVYRDAVNSGNVYSRPINKYEEMQIADVLKRTLGLIKKREMNDSVRQWKWYNPHPETSIEVTDEMTKMFTDEK